MQVRFSRRGSHCLLRFAIALCGLLFFACQSDDTKVDGPIPAVLVPSGEVLSSVPEVIDPDDKYLIYIHGKIMEEQGVGAVSPDFGRYEFEEILEYFADAGFIVIGEVRSGPTDVVAYSNRVVGQVGTLLDAGVPSENINIVGFSKGAWIVLLASAKLADPDIRIVPIAVCGPEANEDPRLDLRGRVLSIYERSDDYGSSCRPLVESSLGVTAFREIEMNTGEKHGAFYVADPAWMDAIISWSGR